MRVLITGGAGLLGSRLATTAPAGTEVHVTVHRSPGPVGIAAHVLDLAEPGAFTAAMASVRPDLVIHTAYRMADGERNIVAATAAVADACAASGSALIHLSTDAVFDGERAPYAEDDRPAPVHPYGLHKAEAEELVRAAVPDAAIVRTSLIVSFDPPDTVVTGWLVGAATRGEPVTLFEDEIRMPVRLDDLAGSLWRLAALDRAARGGVWHLVGPQALSRVEIGAVVARRFGLDPGGFRTGSIRDFAGPRPRDLRLVDSRSAEICHRPLPLDHGLEA